MSSARRSDPQRSAPQDKKNVSCDMAGRRFCLFVLHRGGGTGEGEHRTNRTEAAERPGAFRSGMPGRSGRPGNGRRAKEMSGRRWPKGMSDRRQAAGRQGLRVSGSEMPSDEEPSPGERPPQRPIRPDTARTGHAGRCTLLPGNGRRRPGARKPKTVKP